PRAVAAAKGPPLRAVLWDLDGTLTDSVRLVVETMNAVIATHGGPLLPYEKVGELTGLPLDAMFRLAWPDIGAADVESYRVEYRARYDAVAIPATRLYRGRRRHCAISMRPGCCRPRSPASGQPTASGSCAASGSSRTSMCTSGAIRRRGRSLPRTSRSTP